jgi:hypothetical protein
LQQSARLVLLRLGYPLEGSEQCLHANLTIP